MSKKFHVNETDLLCKNRCGFYGNTLWKGYCSVCYKSIHHRKQQPANHPAQPQHSAQQSHVASSLAKQTGFIKFEEKRRQHNDKRTNTMRSIFGRSTSGMVSRESYQGNYNLIFWTNLLPIKNYNNIP